MPAIINNFIFIISIIPIRLGCQRGWAWKILICKKSTAINLCKVLSFTLKHTEKALLALTWWENWNFKYRAIFPYVYCWLRAQKFGKKINRNMRKKCEIFFKIQKTKKKKRRIKIGGGRLLRNNKSSQNWETLYIFRLQEKKLNASRYFLKSTCHLTRNSKTKISLLLVSSLILLETRKQWSNSFKIPQIQNSVKIDCGMF